MIGPAWVAPTITRVTSNILIVGGWSVLALPRVMLLRADLAAALGSPAEARTWYTKVLSLWSNADPELQPTVARIRSAIAALPPPR